MWVTGLSVWLVNALPSQPPLGWCAAAGAALWTLGFTMEALADWQKLQAGVALLLSSTLLRNTLCRCAASLARASLHSSLSLSSCARATAVRSAALAQWLAP